MSDTPEKIVKQVYDFGWRDSIGGEDVSIGRRRVAAQTIQALIDAAREQGRRETDSDHALFIR